MDGLGNLPEGFARVCAINGGTYMLDRKVDEILFNKNGEAWGIRVAGEDLPRDSQPQVAKKIVLVIHFLNLILLSWLYVFGGLYLQNFPSFALQKNLQDR
jgi:hypothetical protein